MKPISFHIRRLMGGGKKKNEKDTSFKRSDSFKRISIRKNYLDRGGKKKQKTDALNVQQLFKEESKLEEYNIMPVDKPKSSKSKCENIYMKSPHASNNNANTTLDGEYDKLDNFAERSSLAKISSDKRSQLLQRAICSKDVCTQTESVEESRAETGCNVHADNTQNSTKRVPEKIIIHVPASESVAKDDPPPIVTPRRETVPTPVAATRLSSEKCVATVFDDATTSLKRQESDDSAVEMFPWGDSIEILKFDRSPVLPPRRNYGHSLYIQPLLPDSGHESVRNDEMCSLSVSLGRIWMDAPLAMSPRSLELPRGPSQASSSSELKTAHNSLDSALKSNKDDPIVANRLQKKHPRKPVAPEPVSRTLSSSNKTTTSLNEYPYMFSSKDSGFSFSASVPKLSEQLSQFADSSKNGLFRSKKSKDAHNINLLESKFNPVYRTSSRSYKEFRNSIKARRRSKKESSKNDIYTVVVRRPPRSACTVKLDPALFVPPDENDLSLNSVKEMHDYSLPADDKNSFGSFDSGDDFYECILQDCDGTTETYETIHSETNDPRSTSVLSYDSSLSFDVVSVTSRATGSLYVKNNYRGRNQRAPDKFRQGTSCKRKVIHLKNSDFFEERRPRSPSFDFDAIVASSDSSDHEDREHESDHPEELTPSKGTKVRHQVRRRRSRARRYGFSSTSRISDITQKGYEKKRARLLNPHAQKLQPASGGAGGMGGGAPGGGGAGGATRQGPPRARRAQRRVTHNEKRYHSGGRPSKGGSTSPAQRTAQRCRGNRRLTRNESRYHSEVRQEAVQQALAAMQTRPKPSMPMPSKRTSVMAKSPDRECRDSASSSDEDSTGGIVESISAGSAGAMAISGIPRPSSRPAMPPPISSSGISRHHQQIHSHQEISQLTDVMSNLSSFSQGPDVTHTNVNNKRSNAADRVQRFVYQSSEGNNTGTGRWKVSAKIQQLLNTLKRPKRRPLPEFYEDDDIELEIAANYKDPNAPKPEGNVMTPTYGEQLVVPSGLPRNLEAAIQRYGTATFKASVATVLDPNGKTNTLTYGKLFSRVQKISYALLNKTFSKTNEIALKPGDRIALIYPNNDPINFLCAWYGCLQAGIVPVPIEVPLTRRDAGSQQIGFLLGSCEIQIALTSEACLKGLPKSPTGDVITFKGWPRLHWMVTEHLPRAPKDWLPPPRLSDDTPAYIEYTTDKDGSVMGVTVTRASMLAHCRALTMACNYTEGENMVCVLDFKREVGLWHSILTSVLNGMHVIFIPYALMKVNPASWMQMITKYRASVAVVKSRDLHWGLLATKDHKEISLSSVRLLLVADGANPWSLSSCDQFLSVFQLKGLRPDAICPCACGSEAMTVSVRRPGRSGGSTGRGVLSMAGLSHGVVRVDQENSLTSLTLQDCGQVMPGSAIIVVKMDGPSYVCKTDEVGEICVASGVSGNKYWGLSGPPTNSVFGVIPLDPEGSSISDQKYTRSGLLGFLGPGGLVFICGSRDGLMTVSGRKHNMDDIIATVLAVEPMKFIYRGRIAVFSIRVLRDERICVIAEQRPDCSEEESFQWMSRVLQAVDSIHQVGIYCLALVQHNHLPKTPLGGIHLSECKRRFLEGTLHPANVLLCPHTCVTNLPQPREIHSDVGPASVIVGNLVQGNRLASAQGRDMGFADDSDATRKYQFISEILRWRALSTPDHNIFTLLNSKGGVAKMLSCSELHKKAERIGNLLSEKGRINTGDHVALIFPPGLDLICAFYGCLYVGAVPVTIRPPHPQNLQTTLPTVRMIVDVSKSVLVMSNQNVIKLLKSKEASNAIDIKSWPMILDTDDMPKKKLNVVYRAPTAEMLAYLDFSVSTTGMLAGIKMSHAAVTSLCRSMKLACELYPSRHIALCLDPYCGLGFALWCLSSIYSGHHSILIPPSEVEVNAALWLSAVSHYKVRDTFCSYGVMELCTKGLGSTVNQLKSRGVNLGCVRTCVAIAEERPRINLTTSFSKLFSALGLSPRAVSTSFGCRVNIAICLQGASSPEPSTVYVDLRALRNDRVSLVERGSPHSLCVMESGKLLPGVKVIIANPDTKGQCGDSHLGEIWVQSCHNASGYFTIYGEESDYVDHFNARLVTGSTGEVYARTGYLGFLRRIEGSTHAGSDETTLSIASRESDNDTMEASSFQGSSSDSEMQDAVFVVGALDETIIMRGMRYHPIDIENSVMRCHKKIAECAVFAWSNLLVVVAELDGNDSEALNLVPLITNVVLEEHQLIVGVVVVVDPGVVPINSRGEKQRMHLRDGFLSDQIDAIYIAYNM